MKKFAKVISAAVILVLIIGVLFFGFLKIARHDKKPAIISTNFVGYDFARAIVKDTEEVSMLLSPGTDAHSFEPSPDDIINIKAAKLFIYIGGESDSWVRELLKDNEISEENTLRLMDYVDVKTEELVDGMESDDDDLSLEAEYDEHIWTSPSNAIKLVNAIKTKLSEKNKAAADFYAQNAKIYTDKLASISDSFKQVIESANKRELIFGDRFPFRYFVDDYGLKYYAAFPGCSEQTEASSSTIAFLIDKIQQDHLDVVLKIELSSDKLAQAIAEETGAKILTLNSAHNVSREDFENGVTYADILTSNLAVLKEALR